MIYIDIIGNYSCNYIARIIIIYIYIVGHVENTFLECYVKYIFISLNTIRLSRTRNLMR